MGKHYELCTGRDFRGRAWRTVLPAGVARAGMYVRLMGGVFLLIETVEPGNAPDSGLPFRAAAQVLQSVWEGRCHG